VVSIHVPGRSVDDFPMLTHEGIQVLWADMHTNKLRLGHLRGNRFSVRIRGVSPTDVVRAHGVLMRLAREGMPNYLGEQRFGARGNNHLCGKLLLLGEYQQLLDAVLGPGRGGVVDPEVSDRYAQGDFAGALDASRTLPRYERTMLRRLAAGWNAKRTVGDIPVAQRRFWVAAFQSAVFNAVVGQRIDAGALSSLSAGDIAMIHDNGACFRVRDEDVGPDLDERLAALDVSPTGPLWGAKMMTCEGASGDRELAAIEWGGVTPMEFALGARKARVSLEGERRALRVPLNDPEIEGGMDEHGGYVRCAFTLPRGSFATVAMREVMKGESGRADVGGAEVGDG
jgi:tRNA pseudouridine13 synthase